MTQVEIEPYTHRDDWRQSGLRLSQRGGWQDDGEEYVYEIIVECVDKPLRAISNSLEGWPPYTPVEQNDGYKAWEVRQLVYDNLVCTRWMYCSSLSTLDKAIELMAWLAAQPLVSNHPRRLISCPVCYVRYYVTADVEYAPKCPVCENIQMELGEVEISRKQVADELQARIQRLSDKLESAREGARIFFDIAQKEGL